MTTHPDLFTNVHKGIRRALFDTCVALGRADDDVPAATRDQLRAVLHFVRHHGENEDLLLVPLLAEAAPHAHARMRQAHASIDDALSGLLARADRAPASELYHQTCEFVALYLAHMREEELELEPEIRAAVATSALDAFAPGCVARTPPADARVMLGWMLPAMTPHEAEAMLAKLPEGMRSELREFVPPQGIGLAARGEQHTARVQCAGGGD